MGHAMVGRAALRLGDCEGGAWHTRRAEVQLKAGRAENDSSATAGSFGRELSLLLTNKGLLAERSGRLQVLRYGSSVASIALVVLASGDERVPFVATVCRVQSVSSTVVY